MEALLLIDPQNDFCNPDKGALGVPGADEDCRKISEELITDKMNDIFVTMDTHYPLDISHPLFWKDKDGNHPAPLTVIKAEQVKKEWYPLIQHSSWAKHYIEKLEEEGEYDHIIWPEHCIHGSWGHMIYPSIMNSLIEWSQKKTKNFKIIEKGTNIYTEHFGAFQAQVPINREEVSTKFNLTRDNSTAFDSDLYYTLCKYDKVHLAGEAESHCVAYTVHQLNKVSEPDLIKKLVIYKDLMSPVPSFEGSADHVFAKAKELGAEIV